MRIFGALEAEIMTTMWRERQATVKQVHREIVDWRDIAYTTVMTTMERLAEKGVLNRRRQGLAYYYTLACTRRTRPDQRARAHADGRADLCHARRPQDEADAASRQAGPSMDVYCESRRWLVCRTR
jgi:predicted transcriptional regulator